MGAADEYELITRAVHFALSYAEDVNSQVVQEPQTMPLQTKSFLK